MNRNQVCSISGSDLVDSRLDDEDQTGGAKLCPGCGHILDRRDDWVGLPAGVKFDPTDQELIEHLEAKVRCEELRSHPLIDEFIPTIEGEDGICYTHPEKLPGVSKDGLSKHFFHRPSKAYTTGTRKRRKIQTEPDNRLQGGGSSGSGETRWHKTGKTRPVMVNGRQKGCKKILVLYTNFGKHRKPEKTNWVMHQYHLGVLEEERDGELVVSKVFYQTQPRQCGGGAAGWPIDNRKEAPAVTTTGLGSAEDLSCVAAGISGYGGGGDTFSFAPFRKSFDEVGTEHAVQACGDHLDVHVTAASAFHVSRRTVPVSGMAAAASHHQTSVVLVEPYQRLILQNQGLEQHHEEEQGHQKLIRRPSSSGLEDVIMGCTADGLGEPETTVPSRQQQGWLGYSYWPDTDNQNQPR